MIPRYKRYLLEIGIGTTKAESHIRSLLLTGCFVKANACVRSTSSMVITTPVSG